MLVRGVAVVLLLAFAPSPLRAQAQPKVARLSEPYVQPGICPFECCQYGPWVARKPFKVYDGAHHGAAAVATLRKGTSFRAQTGEMHFSRLGRVVLARRYALQSDAGDTVWMARGDTLTILSYEGEGYYDAWYRGTIYSVDEFWDEPGAKRRVPPAAGTMVRTPEGMWWVRVRLHNGRRGWIRSDEMEVDGADACG
jgi:hypothetical protein